MTLNILWALYATIRTSDSKALAVGMLIGLVLYVPFIAFQQNYVGTHREDLQKILQIR